MRIRSILLVKLVCRDAFRAPPDVRQNPDGLPQRPHGIAGLFLHERNQQQNLAVGNRKDNADENLVPFPQFIELMVFLLFYRLASSLFFFSCGLGHKKKTRLRQADGVKPFTRIFHERNPFRPENPGQRRGIRS